VRPLPTVLAMPRMSMVRKESFAYKPNMPASFFGERSGLNLATSTLLPS
jgi:hypothetical protein